MRIKMVTGMAAIVMPNSASVSVRIMTRNCIILTLTDAEFGITIAKLGVGKCENYDEKLYFKTKNWSNKMVKETGDTEKEVEFEKRDKDLIYEIPSTHLH